MGEQVVVDQCLHHILHFQFHLTDRSSLSISSSLNPSNSVSSSASRNSGGTSGLKFAIAFNLMYDRPVFLQCKNFPDTQSSSLFLSGSSYYCPRQFDIILFVMKRAIICHDLYNSTTNHFRLKWTNRHAQHMAVLVNQSRRLNDDKWWYSGCMGSAVIMPPGIYRSE